MIGESPKIMLHCGKNEPNGSIRCRRDDMVCQAEPHTSSLFRRLAIVKNYKFTFCWLFEFVEKRREEKKRKWTWIGHQLRKDPGNITRQALRWNPQGKRKRGRPRNSWRRSVEDEMKAAGYSWQSMTQHAQNRVRWRKIVSGLYSAKE